MKSTALAKPLLAIALCAAASLASAHGDVKCTSAPKTEWRSHDDLARKLQSEGWIIRRMEVSKSCYEVYAKDPQGKRVEAFFDPVTFARVEE
jgi:hypothetical protein